MRKCPARVSSPRNGAELPERLATSRVTTGSSCSVFATTKWAWAEWIERLALLCCTRWLAGWLADHEKIADHYRTKWKVWRRGGEKESRKAGRKEGWSKGRKKTS